MSESSKRLVREESVRRVGRVVRAEAFEAAEDAPEEGPETRGGRVRREGRTNRRARAEAQSGRGEGPRDLRSDLSDLQRGVLYAGIEAIAATVDTASTVMRNAVDRSLSRRYSQPGDMVRNVGSDLSSAAQDVVDGVTEMPERLNGRFYEAAPRRRAKARGERQRRAEAGDED